MGISLDTCSPSLVLVMDAGGFFFYYISHFIIHSFESSDGCKVYHMSDREFLWEVLLECCTYLAIRRIKKVFFWFFFWLWKWWFSKFVIIGIIDIAFVIPMCLGGTEKNGTSGDGIRTRDLLRTGQPPNQLRQTDSPRSIVPGYLLCSSWSHSTKQF